MMGQPSGWGRGRFYSEGARPLYPRPLAPALQTATTRVDDTDQ